MQGVLAFENEDDDPRPDREEDRKIESLGGEGILKPSDLPDLGEGCMRVLGLMNDGEWHDANAIIAASKQREGLRRMREWRKYFTIERRRLKGKRDFEYKLTMMKTS